MSESISHPDNRGYIRRATDVLCDAIVDVFYAKHGDPVKKESSFALGRVGAVLAEQGDYDKFRRLLWEGHAKAKKEPQQVHFLRALTSFLRARPALVADEEIR